AGAGDGLSPTAEGLHKIGDRVRSCFEVAAPGEPLSAPGAKIVITIRGPVKPDAWRQGKLLDLRTVSKRIALTLHNESRGSQSGEMLRSKLLGLSGRVKGIAETNEARDAPFGQQLIR